MDDAQWQRDALQAEGVAVRDDRIVDFRVVQWWPEAA